MKTKLRYEKETECFIDTLLYRCPKCKQTTEVAMMVGEKVRDVSYYTSQFTQLQDMYIRLRRHFDTLIKAIRIVRSKEVVAQNKSSLKCTCAWEWPCMTVGDPDDTANIVFHDPKCPVHNKH